MRISNNTILITGGGSGIGRALANAFYRLGNKLILVGRNQTKLEKAKQQLPGIQYYTCDVSDTEQAEALMSVLHRDHSDLNVIVNNTGMFRLENLTKNNGTLEEQLVELLTNFVAPIQLTQGLLDLIQKNKWPAVVNVTSGLVFVPFAAAPMYSASKAALHAYTVALRSQFKAYELRIFEVFPPVVETDMSKPLGMNGMDSAKHADDVIDKMQKDQFEIRPGQSQGLYLMSRLFPRHIQSKLDKEALSILKQMVKL